MRFGHTYPPPSTILRRASWIDHATNSAGVLQDLNQLDIAMIAAANAADGDKYYAEFCLSGTETLLSIGINKNTYTGKFDLYVNGVKDDMATYDTYAASNTWTYTQVTLCAATLATIKAGYNQIELRVNGKNASSSDYSLRLGHLSFY